LTSGPNAQDAPEEGLAFKHWPGPAIETGAWDYGLRPHGPALCVLRRAGLRFSKQVPHGPDSWVDTGRQRGVNVFIAGESCQQWQHSP
jgi:hypothetical protein